MPWLDRLVAGVLAPLAVWVLVSGLDDLVLDLASIWLRFVQWRRREPPGAACVPGAVLHLAEQGREKKIALLVPAWREDGVIARMLEHNIGVIRYSAYEVFVGVYPNDIRTMARVGESAQKFGRVHRVVCPHNGPTSKADCLNWTYQGMLGFEAAHACRFEVLLHHDAEDLVHPQSLAWINRYTDDYDMVQVPVLPLPTPWWQFTHGAYCDEFAQFQLRDLRVRQWLGGFMPSSGVGTAYHRHAADRLAWNQGDQLFQTASLTEDYHMGLNLHRLGCRQILLDAQALAGSSAWMATREYFPRTVRAAIRQKARWVAGIALQSWQEIGWSAGEKQLYWLWRDRKGLLGNPLSILANLIFLYGAFCWMWALHNGGVWHLAVCIRSSAILPWLLAANTVLIAVRLGSRAFWTRKVYGWRHALISPLRSIWGNGINFAASARAVRLFAGARMRREIPQWLKTEHFYPSRQVLREHQPGPLNAKAAGHGL